MSNSDARRQVAFPCAACKMLRRKCGEKCVLAPYFPPTDIHKFATAHRVFGASNIIKILQDIPAQHREDAVSSIVYEASARMVDPVYGCMGIICHLQSQLSQVQSQLAIAEAEIVNLRLQQKRFLGIDEAIVTSPNQDTFDPWESLWA